MHLKINVLNFKGQPPPEAIEASFNQDGGTIGRLEGKRNNHLCLPDPDRYISRIHAKITFEGNTFFLTDSSVDGTCVKNRDNCIRGDRVRLADGDCLWIGDYELRAHIDPPEYISSLDNISDRQLDEPTDPSGQISVLEQDNDWWPDATGKFFDNHDKQSTTSNRADGTPLHDAFRPPGFTNESDAPGGIPEDFDFGNLIHGNDAPHDHPETTEPYRNPKAPTALADRPQKSGNKDPFSEIDENGDDPAGRQRIRQQAFDDLFHIFLKAAGVTDTSAIQTKDIPQIMETLGIVFKEMISELRIFLKGRSEQKKQFRVSTTQLMPTDNNPLKFFDNLDEIIDQLVLGNKPGFMDAPAAVREGFADLMNHQLAMTAGIQAAVFDLIERFDPQQFINQHNGSKFTPKKAKSWDAFRQAHAEIANTAMDDFFGEPFTRAYEAQLRRLQTTQSEKRNRAKKSE